MRIIIINNFPTSTIFGDKIDPWWFESQGFDVEFWDLSRIFFSRSRLSLYFSGNQSYKFLGPKHQYFTKKNDVLDKIESLGDGDIVWQISWTLSRVRIYDNWLLKSITHKKIPIVVKEFQTNPIFSGLRFVKQNIKDNISKFNFLNRHPSIYIGCGSVSRQRANKIINTSKFVSIPSPNILWEDATPEISGDYIVFVDDSIEYSPDAKMFNSEICNDLKGYYNRLNKVFSALENKFKMPVIIGASGKYFYSDNKFEDRDIIYKKTLSLIKNSNLVIGHSSIALFQAIADEKPLLRLTDKSFVGVKIFDIHYWNVLISTDDINTENISLILSKADREMDQPKNMSKVKEMFLCEEHLKSFNYREVIRDAILSL